MSGTRSRKSQPGTSADSDFEKLFTNARQILKAADKDWPKPLGGFTSAFKEKIRSEVIGQVIDSLVQDWKSREYARRKPPEPSA